MSELPKVAMVTGAGAGAGRAIAERLGSEGWRVGLISRDRDRLEAAARSIQERGGQGLALPLDVADPAAVRAARDQLIDAFGDIGVWVNCAMATIVGEVIDIAPEDFKRVVDVTLLGYVHGTQAALEVMQPKNAGRIIQVGSALAYRAIPLQSAYCACKFAIRGFTDSLRSELIHARSDVTLTMLQMPGMNTIQFDWAKNLFSHKYQPVGGAYDPSVAADAVMRAIREHPRELWVGKSAIQAIVGNMVFPPYLDRVLAKKAIDEQITDTPEIPGRPNNLYEPVKADVGARGRFGKEAKPQAFILDPTRARLALAAVAGTGLLVAGGAALARSLRR